MSFIKVINPGAYDFDGPTMRLIKIASRRTWGSSDRSDFIKIAGAEMAYNVDRYREKLAADEPLIHLLAIGATEDYGSNRNGDGFRRAVCESCHPSFEKYAFFYRNHKNKDPKKSYGRVIKSAYHAPMKRVELLVALNGSEDAARRNNALFADREMEKLASGKDIPVSMACKVTHDVCSYCGNQAPKQDDYCWGTDMGGMCKAGGLRDNIGALVEIDGGIHQLHADNPNPAFFDISHVFRGADRIAYVSGMLEKAANAHGVVSGAMLARQLGVELPYELAIDSNQPANVQVMMKIAYELADLESQCEADTLPFGDVWAAALAPEAQATDLDLPPYFREKFATALRAMADQRISLPLAKFIEVAADYPMEKAAETAAVVQRHLPGVFTRLTEGGQLAEKLAASKYVPSAAAAPAPFAKWAEKQASALSLRERHARHRIHTAALYGVDDVSIPRGEDMEKVASDGGGPASELAEQYALYKLAFLGAIPQDDPESQLTRSLVILQNHTS